MRILSTLLLASLLMNSSPLNAQTIVAHRGASFDAPENTMSAFREAWKQGADVIEGDFYLTADGQIVCLHDKTTKRTTRQTSDVEPKNVTLEELRKLDFGSWKDPKFAGEKIPLLSEVLDAVPEGKKIYVEVKAGPKIVAPMKKVLEASGLKDEQIIIITFSTEVVIECRELIPQYKCNWLSDYKKPEGQTTWTPALPEVLATLKKTGATGFGTQANDEVITEDFVSAVRKAGFEFHVWTVDSPDQAQRYQTLGVDSITTNRPAFIREALGK